MLVLACLMTEFAPMTGLAAERQYSVRFHGGNVGKINGTSDFKGTYESYVTAPAVTENSDYYLKGFKESGKDPTSFYSPGGMIQVTKDIDYVAVYGIKGTEVKYTVQYLLSGTTTKLAPDGTFYAGIGDKPISSYIYIEGYQPSQRSTKTLVADESQNVLFCYYTAIPTATTTTTTTTTTVAGGGGGAAVAAGAANAANAAGGANAANPAGGANAANPVNPANPANPAGGVNATNPAGGGENTAPAAPQYQQTEDILDLDVPLAAPDFGTTVGQQAVPNAPKVIEPTQRSPIPNWMLIAGVGILVGLIAMLYWYLLFYRKKKRFKEYNFSAFDE